MHIKVMYPRSTDTDGTSHSNRCSILEVKADMFRNQCEQTKKGLGCEAPVGVCEKNEDVQSLQEMLLYGLKGMARPTPRMPDVSAAVMRQSRRSSRRRSWPR